MKGSAMKNDKGKKQREKIIQISWHDTWVTALLLIIATVLSIAVWYWERNDVLPALIYVLSVMFIARRTSGYFYGALSSVIAMFVVNFAFMHPYHTIHSSFTSYPVVFLTMLLISIVAGAATSMEKRLETSHLENEKGKMRANLLRSVSHDIRTPLTAIAGETSALLEYEDQIPPEKRRQMLYSIHEDANHLIQMVENLLSVTRIGDHRVLIHKDLEMIEEIFEATVTRFKKQFPGIRIRQTLPEESLAVPMDGILISQVLYNLLHNAVIHGKTTTHILLSATVAKETVIIRVADNGDGISAEILPFIPDRYMEYRTSDTAEQAHRNMGIGLSACSSIIQAHGGTLTAANREEGGAVFTFTLPWKEEDHYECTRFDSHC